MMRESYAGGGAGEREWWTQWRVQRESEWREGREGGEALPHIRRDDGACTHAPQPRATDQEGWCMLACTHNVQPQLGATTATAKNPRRSHETSLAPAMQ